MKLYADGKTLGHWKPVAESADYVTFLMMGVFVEANLQRIGDDFVKELTIRLWSHVKTAVCRRMLRRKAQVKSIFAYQTCGIQ